MDDYDYVDNNIQDLFPLDFQWGTSSVAGPSNPAAARPGSGFLPMTGSGFIPMPSVNPNELISSPYMENISFIPSSLGPSYIPDVQASSTPSAPTAAYKAPVSFSDLFAAQQDNESPPRSTSSRTGPSPPLSTGSQAGQSPARNASSQPGQFLPFNAGSLPRQALPHRPPRSAAPLQAPDHKRRQPAELRQAPDHKRHQSTSPPMASASTSVPYSPSDELPKPRREAHNKIEKRYRGNLNYRISYFNRIVPALRIAEARLERGDSPTDDLNDDELAELDGLVPPQKLGKAVSLAKAAECLEHTQAKLKWVEKENERLKKENEQLKKRL